ncbi:MAG: hypothetical protein RML45_16230 [Acetobacteraceae bacterium]|nr:hypothetical protein [Acetobacteraceae bacterium]
MAAHWQVGHWLRAQGAPLGEVGRAAIYLANALTGWGEAAAEAGRAGEDDLRLVFPPLTEKRDAATGLSANRPILAVLGNPPYNAFAGTSPREETGPVEPYKRGMRERRGVRKFNLDDLSMRFFRVALRRIAEQTGRGVVCFVSNSSWLTKPSIVVIRQRLLGSFDRFWIDNMQRRADNFGVGAGRAGRANEPDRIRDLRPLAQDQAGNGGLALGAQGATRP